MPIIFILICTLFNSAAQVFYKIGAKHLAFDFFKLITNYWLILGLVIYGISFIFFVLGLKHGELTILYPILATGYIWVSLASVYFFGETMNIWKWSGIGLIMIGIIVLSSQNKHEALDFTEAI